MNIIENFINKIEYLNIDVHSCLINYQNQNIYEQYAKPYEATQASMVYSISKSLVSLAIGYLIELGKLNLDDCISQFFPEITVNIPKTLTIKHLLTMQSGTYKEQMIMFSDQWIKQYFEQDFYYLPGTHFHYNSMNSYILSVIVSRITGQKLVDFLDKYLFKPLKIQKPQWDEDQLGNNLGGWGVYLTPRQMQTLGQAMLNNHPTLPLNYVQDMIHQQCDSYSSSKCKFYEQGYGYHCWMNEQGLGYRFDGLFGQFVIIIPSLKLTIVTTGSIIKSNLLLEAIFENLVKPLNLQLLQLNTNPPLPLLDVFKCSKNQLDQQNSNQYYIFKDNASSLVPLSITFLKRLPFSHAKGFLVDIKENYIDLFWQEYQTTFHLKVSLTSRIFISKININQETFSVYACGYIENNSLYIKIYFLEFAHRRLLKIDFLSKEKVIIFFDEQPSIQDLLDNYQYLLTFTPFNALNSWVVEKAYHLVNPSSIAMVKKKKEA